MRAIDTNLLVRLVARDDKKQVEAAEAFVKNGAWVSLLALAELTWVISTVYERKAGEVATTVEMLLNHKTLTIQDPDVVSLALAHFRKRPAIGFSEFLLLEIARKAGHLPIGAFDRDFSKQPDVERI